ncbi:MAG: radical SAM protein [Verrucomicrobiales bacterium]
MSSASSRRLLRRSLYRDIGISTNGTLLAAPQPDRGGKSAARCLVESGVRTANISLDSLDPESYRLTTGRDFHAAALEGIEAAREAGFEKVKLNCVLMKGRNDHELFDMVEFADDYGCCLLLRFIELMPVTTAEVLDEDNFLSAGMAKRMLELRYGKLEPRPDFRTNGPSTYYAVPGRDQLVGFIGAMTNLHFCETCNKLRLTCDGKLRPCLGSFLEFDIMEPLRAGATDAELAAFFQSVVARKPEQHDFRDNYQPNRRMVAIGG